MSFPRAVWLSQVVESPGAPGQWYSRTYWVVSTSVIEMSCPKSTTLVRNYSSNRPCSEQGTSREIRGHGASGAYSSISDVPNFTIGRKEKREASLQGLRTAVRERFWLPIRVTGYYDDMVGGA